MAVDPPDSTVQLELSPMLTFPHFLRRLTAALALFALTMPARADVVINEIMAASSDRLLQWDGSGVPYVGTGTRWYQAAFGDAAWAGAPGPFGYGTLTNGPTAIATNLQPAVQYLTTTTYFRRNFTVSAGDQARPEQVQLLVEYNDGFVAYLNGVEVARRNGGPVNKFIFHDQPAYNREVFSGTAPIPTTTLTETIDLGAASTKLLVGDNILAIHLLNAPSTTSSVGYASDTTFYLKASLAINGAPVVPLVNYNDSWKYFPGVVEPSGNLYDPAQLGSGKQNVSWGRLSYDDATWASGVGPFGYGSVGTIGTNTQAAMLNVTPALYARIVFTATGAEASDPLPLKLVMGNDDGFVAYINGVEVARRRIGLPNTYTPRDAVADGDVGVQNETITLDAASKLLVSGTNVLAIQAHNYTAGNGDFLIKADLQNNAGTKTFAANNAAWKYFVGTTEPVADVVSGEEDSAPDGPDATLDWIELHNNGVADVSLQNWTITDDATNTTKWVFPAVTIPAGGYLVVVADNLDIKTNPGGFLHTNFKLDADGEFVGLYDQTGTAVSQLAPTYPPMTAFQSYARNGGGTFQYSSTPTPGAVNAGAYFDAIVATPTVSLPGRFYTGSQSVTLSCATPGAEIRYTTNGSEPVATSTLASAAVPISATTVLRARAFKANHVPSQTVTHTYLLNQSSARQSLPAVCLNGDQQQSFYRPFGVFAVVNNTATNYFGGAWSNHPGATSFTVGNAGFTPEDPSLYNAPMQSGKPAERPITFEMLHTDAKPDLRTGAFIRAAGSPFSRHRYVLTDHNLPVPNALSPWTSNSTQKPQLNLFFRDELGQSPLLYPLVPGSAVTKYENIRLRAGKNDITSPFIRDEFVRRLSLQMGQISVRGDFVNMYLNGVFKGYFNICERPREAFFQEARGTNNGFDVRNITVIADGDTLAYNEMFNYAKTRNMATYADYVGMQQRVDVVNIADYIILNVDAAMADWPGNNYVMDRERSASGVFRFSVWDAEGGYGGFGNNPSHKTFNGIYNAAPAGETVPAKLVYSVLRSSPEWRMLAADRIQKHYFNNGTLTDANKQSRWSTLAAQIQPIMTEVGNGTVGNFPAIWLNGQGDTTRYTLSAGATGSIVNCPSRRTALFTGFTDDSTTLGGGFQQAYFAAQGLWPATVAPTFSQNGGAIGTGINLTITNPNGGGTIYYTIGGLDPRAVGGAAQGTAYTGPIPVNQTTVVKARIFTGSEWSPLMEATFATTSPAPILITELMYHPLPPGVQTNDDDYEFLEIKNIGPATLQLGGMSFSAGITFTFPAGSTLPAGAFAVVAKNAAVFATRYPGVTVLGQYTDKLDNGGETVTLVDSANATIFSVTYNDIAPWPTDPDGDGKSLVPFSPNINPNPSDAVNWRVSTNINGSPGQDDPFIVAPIVINEVLAYPAAGQAVTIEFYNGSPTLTQSVGDWWLSDSTTTPKKFRIPAGVSIGPDAYLLFTESDFNPTPGIGNSFALSRAGGTLVLNSGDATGNLTGYTQSVTYGATDAGYSTGPYTNSQGVPFYPVRNAVTLGGVNAGVFLSPVVLTELMYNPLGAGQEFIEIRNVSAAPVPLFDPANPSNTWRIFGVGPSLAAGGGDLVFPAGITLQPGQIILVTQLAPGTFRGLFSIPASISIYGPYSNSMSNDGERIALRRPGQPYLSGATTVVPLMEVDSVTYDDLAPWPVSPDGTGPSLERIQRFAFADDPVNWRASPAAPAPGGSPGKPPALTFAQWRPVYFTAAEIADAAIAGPDADPDGDGLSNFWEHALGRHPRIADAAGSLATGLANDGAAGPYLTMTFRRDLGAKAAGMQYHVDTTGDLTAWGLNAAAQVGAATVNADGTETVTYRDTMTTGQAQQRFIRLRLFEN